MEYAETRCYLFEIVDLSKISGEFGALAETGHLCGKASRSSSGWAPMEWMEVS